MSQAQRVEFYGFGASGAVAADAQHKFFRLLLTAAAPIPTRTCRRCRR
jgi:RpiR family carbohydrate utilization transcriptional regulator